MGEVEKELLVAITNDNVAAFKKAYHIAKKKNKKFFYFENRKTLTNYAKYVVEFIDQK